MIVLAVALTASCSERSDPQVDRRATRHRPPPPPTRRRADVDDRVAATTASPTTIRHAPVPTTTRRRPPRRPRPRPGSSRRASSGRRHGHGRRRHGVRAVPVARRRRRSARARADVRDRPRWARRDGLPLSGGRRPASFWMKNTVMPLSIAFFDGDGAVPRQLRHGSRAPPIRARSYPTPDDFVMAIEVAAGRARRARRSRPGSTLRRQRPALRCRRLSSAVSDRASVADSQAS